MFSPSNVEAEEKRSIEAYCQEHQIDGLLQELVEGLLRDRPKTTAKVHFAHIIRLKLMKDEPCSEYEEVVKAAEVPGHLLKNLFEATKKITAEIVPRETIRLIIQETLKLLSCDRVSLFIFDRRINMLVLNASNLEQPSRVQPGQGIAGSVFKTGQTVNIPDCYQDARFEQTFDDQTGYRTNNLCTMPIIDFEGECMGVLQAINKLDAGSGGFTSVDE
ncbi:unnamed protein product, partial [Polarella glacialis]